MDADQHNIGRLVLLLNFLVPGVVVFAVDAVESEEVDHNDLALEVGKPLGFGVEPIGGFAEFGGWGIEFVGLTDEERRKEDWEHGRASMTEWDLIRLMPVSRSGYAHSMQVGFFTSNVPHPG